MIRKVTKKTRITDLKPPYKTGSNGQKRMETHYSHRSGQFSPFRQEYPKPHYKPGGSGNVGEVQNGEKVAEREVKTVINSDQIVKKPTVIRGVGLIVALLRC